MKIVQVNDTFIPGRGIDRVIYEVAKRLDADLTVIASKIEYDIKDAEMIEFSTRKIIHPVLWMIKKVRNYVNENPSSTFHFHHMVLNWALKSPKTLCTFHGWSPELFDRSSLIKRKLRQKFLEVTAKRYALAPKVTAVNSYQIPFLENLGVKSPVHIPNGVDTAKFLPSNADKGYMLFVGRLTDQKRPDELVRLSNELNYPLHMVGSGPLKESLTDLIEKLDAPVKLLGRIDEKALIGQYQNSSFFISASRWEGMTLTVPEAYACSKPALVYNIPAMAEYPIGAKCTNYASLLAQAKQLIDDEPLRRRLGEMARSYAERNLSWETIVQKYMRLYESLQ